MLMVIVIHDTHSAKISQKQEGHNIDRIMKESCLSGYQHNCFMATHAIVHMMYGCSLLVPMNQRVFNKLSKKGNISCRK